VARTISSTIGREGLGRTLSLVLWPAALVFGIAAILVGRPELVALDGLTGFVLLGLGLAAWSVRPRSAAGLIMATAGFAWFLGALAPWAVYLHRGPLAHLILTYPTGRLTASSRPFRAAIVAAYAYAAAYPIARNDYATMAFALGLTALATRRYVAAGGPERRARLTALIAATAFGLVLVVGVATRAAEMDADSALLWAYDAVVCLVAIGLFADLLWGRWAQAAVTGLVVDLGEPGASGTLRDRLARTLGDASLVVGYWRPEQNRYADEAGRPVDLPVAEAQRALTPIDEDGRRVAVVVHDRALLDDPALVSAVASVTRLAVSNARLQAEVRERVAEVEASRRRIIEAADDQRDRLGRELRTGTEHRLLRVAELVGEIDPELERQVAAARAELEELGLGIHPRALAVEGLGAALRELAGRSSVPVTIVAPTERLPAAAEAAGYFLCSEALANVAKYARASRATIRVTAENELFTVEVSDDGVGGADPSAGSGLRGLADRVEALGGQLVVESPRGRGTRLVARLPYESMATPSSSTAG
jgi:signal transduction histidine kinase